MFGHIDKKMASPGYLDAFGKQVDMPAWQGMMEDKAKTASTDGFVHDVGDAPACGIASGRTCRVGLEDAVDLFALGQFGGGLILRTIQDSRDQ
jgi:hypothetical protein